MKCVFTLLLPLLWLCPSANAQSRDWSTIRENDTPFFAGSIYNTKAMISSPYHGLSGRLIRRIAVDSVHQSSNSRLLFFPHTMRDVDTSAPIWPGNSYARLKASWQGPFCKQLADTTDEFYNFRGDTIRIQILAALGASWTLVKDSSGREIRATVTAMGPLTLNGIADSFREVQLQAYVNNVPIAHLYNNRLLQWTKNQGWKKTLDWYVFPYGTTTSPTSYSPRFGAKEDSALYDRIEDTVNLLQGRTITDLQRRYRPGNAWRTYAEDGQALSWLSHYWYDHDSVLSVTIQGNTCVAQMQRSRCDFRLVLPTGPGLPYWRITPQTGILYTDSMVADTGYISPRQWIIPDEGWDYLLTGRICGVQQVCQDLSYELFGNIIASGNIERVYTRSAAGWGSTANWYGAAFSEMYMPYNYFRLEYLKTDSCTWGNYINVPALGVESKLPEENDWTISPNPAHQQLVITLPNSATAQHYSIRNLQGQIVANGRITGTQTLVAVHILPAGLYLMQISGNDFTQTRRFVVQH